MEGLTLGAMIFSALFVLMMLGLPIGFSLGVVGFVFALILLGPQTAFSTLNLIYFNTFDSVVLFTIPMFVLMAELLWYTGAGEGLFDTAEKWLSGLPGGLLLVTIAVCAAIGTISGSSAAAAAAIGIFAIPQMLSKGYDKSLTVGTVAAAGGLAHLIPPSILAVIYATMTEQSIPKLFAASFVPGILLASLMYMWVLFLVLRNPSLAPRPVTVTWHERWVSLKGLLPTIILVVLILGSLFTGLASVTESAALGAFGSLGLAIAKKRLNWHALREATLRTVQTSCFIFVVVGGGHLIGVILSAGNVPQQFMALVQGLSASPIVTMFIIQGIYVFLGCFLDGASMIIVTVPVIFPIVTTLGFHPIWFGVSLLVNIEMAVITPPVGLNLYIVKNISPPEVRLEDILKGALPFLIAEAMTLVLMIFFPQIALIGVN